jgi:hypothetical protein
LCVAVIVPQNAFLRASGDGWECQRGFENIGQSCVRIHLPRNAHLDFSGNAWECDAGYVARQDRCIAAS